MKIHNIVIIFVAICIAVFIPYNYISQKPIAYNRGNIEYGNILTSACYDAAKTMEVHDTGVVWANKGEILDTLDVFYKSLASSFKLTDTPMEESMKDRVPFTILVDTDGFYLSVNACFDEEGNYIVDRNNENINNVTRLNTWTETINGNYIRFYLYDYVEVTTPDNSFLSGSHAEVYSILEDRGNTYGLTFLADDNMYEEMKINTIVGKIEDTINYYLNTQTVNIDSYNTGYNVTMPRLTGEEWSRMLKNPTVISFLQGNQQIVANRLLDVYGYAAGELTKTYPYFIVDDQYYWSRRRITERVENGVTVYLFNDAPIDNLYHSIEECARKGAVPAVE